MRKRLLAILLTLGMALALLPTSALAYIGAMGESEVYTQTYADNDFIYLENSSLRFMIERDYGHGMLLWTSDEVVGWGQGVQEMRFTIQYPGQAEREMNVTRLEQRYGLGVIWLVYHFGNDHYRTPGDVEITYEAEITLVQLDSGAATGTTGQYIGYNADGTNNWGVLIKGEFEYDSDSVSFTPGGELDQRGATARVYTTFEGFPNMGHETYQNQEAPVSVMLSSYTYDDNYYNYGRIHTATNISRGLGMTSTHIDDSDHGGITEIYTSGYAWASPFIATSNFYHTNTGWADLGQYSETNPEGIAGYPDRNENLGVNDQIYDTRDKRGRSLNLPSYVSYSPGSTSGECVVTTVSEAIMLGYKSGDGVTVYDSDMASLLYGYRNVVDTSTTPTRPSDRDNVNVAEDADRLAIWYENGNVRVEPVLGEGEVPDNAVAVLRGTFEETDDGTGYRFLNGVAALSPTVTAAWTGFEGSKWALIVNKNGTISVDGYVTLNAPSFKFYQAKDTQSDGLKLEITKDGIKMTMTPSNNSAVPYVDIPNTTVRLESGIIQRDGGLEFRGELEFNHFFTNSALEMERLAYGYSGSQFTIFGVEATGDIQKTELAGLELGSVKGDINTFTGSNTFNFNAELDVFSLFEAQAELNFSRMDNGELMPDDIYFNISSGVGIPITPPAPLAKLKGGGAGIYNLATTINGDWYAIPPILLRGTVETEIVNLLTGTADATLGPSQIELIGRDIKIKAIGNLEVIEEVGVGVYLGAQTIDGYTGGSFNGELRLKAGLPSTNRYLNFIKMNHALSLGVFGGVNSSNGALLRVTGNAKGGVEIQFPDAWPVIGGWNLLGAELNAAAGAQMTIDHYSGNISDIFDDAFEDLDIYLGVAATASLLGSEGRVWVLLPDVVDNSAEGVNWGYDYKLAGELPEWSWEGIVPYSTASANSGGRIALMSAAAPASAATTTVTVIGVTGEQSGYILLAFDESVTEKQLRSGLRVAKDGEPVNLVWAERDANGYFTNADTANVSSDLAKNNNSGENERVVMIYVGKGETGSGTYTVTSDLAPVCNKPVTVDPLDRLNADINTTSKTVTARVEYPEADAKYILRTYLSTTEDGADYLVDEREVTSPNVIVSVPQSGTAAPSGNYYITTYLMREETYTPEEEDAQSKTVMVAIDSAASTGTVAYTNSSAPTTAPGNVALTAIGNENMTASWSAVEGADGYKIVIYDENGNDTGLGYEYDATQFVSGNDDYISGLSYDADAGTYSIDMAMTVGGAETADGTPITLDANKNYIVGVSAYKSADIPTGEETQSVKYYGPEQKSAAAYLPEYREVDFDITYRNSAPLKPDANGMYTYLISEILDDAQVEVKWNRQSSSETYTCKVTRTDTGTDLTTRESGAVGIEFDVPDFDGTLPLRIEVNITHTVGGVEVTDTTVKYLTIILDDVAPVLTFDAPYYYAASDGSFTATGITEPGATIRYSLPNEQGVEMNAGNDGRFSISGKLTNGDGLMLTVEVLDEAYNMSRASTIITTEPEVPVIPDSDDPDEPYIPPVPSYRVTIGDTANGTVTAPPAAARQGATVTLTVTPEEGYAVDEIIVTDFFGSRVDVTRNIDGTYSFVMPYSQVEVDVTFTRTEEPTRFTDVPEGAYYYDAVYWAVENGVTVGATATTFNPGGNCTRAQMVTFLWRAAGSPEPATTVNPFTDVDANDYYYEAVLWAVENGVTVGATATTFNPGGECTRAQMVTFLWRAAESPEPTTTVNPFTDVDAGDYYCKAVLWAVENGITVGATATTFAPVAVCTRAQAVTFLYRAQG